MIRRMLSLILIVVVAFSMTVSVYADSNEKHDYSLDNIAPDIGEFKYNPELAALIKHKEELAEKYYHAKMSGNTELAESLLFELKHFNEKKLKNSKKEIENFKNIFSKEIVMTILYINQFPQSKYNYCGYAAIKSLLDFEGINKSQHQIASEVYNTNSSCPWYLSNGNSLDQFPVPNYLRNQMGFSYTPFPYGTAGTVNITTEQVKYRVVSTIDNGHGVMACGASRGDKVNHESYLPGYPKRRIGHWLAVRGYRKYGNTVEIVDPAKSSAVSFGNDIEAYYDISTSKLRAFASEKGIVW